MNCWICGALATTGEHKIKKSDLRSIFRWLSQKRPVFYHDKNVRNRKIGSFQGAFLKFKSRLCAHCNGALTQPYDRSWEKMSEWLRGQKPPLQPDDVVCVSQIFEANAAEEMRNVQLFFTKIIGCQLIEAGVSFDQRALADSILKGKANSLVYLKFGTMGHDRTLVGMSDLELEKLTDNSLAFAIGIYDLGYVAVQFMYAIPGEQRDGLVNAWHPNSNSDQMIIDNFGETEVI